MKCMLALVACWSCLSEVSSAQIIIQKSDAQTLLNPGGQFQFFSDTSSMIVNVGRAGGPNIYDFTSLPFFKEADVTVFLAAQVPQLSARYPSNSFFLAGSLQNIEDISVHSFSGDSLFSHGDHITISSGSERYQHRIPSQLAEKYPLMYGSTWSTSHNESDTTYVNGVPTAGQTKLRTNTAVVDGYGTLRIPGYEFQCLRLRFFQTGNSGDSKRFIYETRNGVSVTIYSRTDQPDTGNVQTQGAFYFLGGSLVRVQSEETLPETFVVKQNYPNPFNPSTTIEFSLPQSGYVTLNVYDIFGKEVATLVAETLSAGRYTAKWNAANFASGMYYYRIQAGSFIETRKLIFLK